MVGLFLIAVVLMAEFDILAIRNNYGKKEK